MSNLFRMLPSVDSLLDALTGQVDAPRTLVRDLVNEFLDDCRQGIRDGSIATEDDLALDNLLPGLEAFVQDRSRPHFRRVLNATGVVIHTNLGRSLLAESAARAVYEACAHYSNLEFNLETGLRGSRYSHVEELLCKVTGAEAALVVNNNAAAVLIVLDTLAKGREVIVSRGQLVEIGGSFRIPEVMEKSGATLVEVGATNRTHLKDYEQAITEDTAMLLKVHTSNYRVVGFTKEVELAELAELGKRRGIPVVEDLGSGNLQDFTEIGFQFEPRVQETVATGADVITFSGDKVLGGPQAGIIVGNREIIEQIKRNPLNRAVRIDKMTLAALEATLRLYLDPDKARAEVPTINMILASQDGLKRKAGSLARLLQKELGHEFLVTTREDVSRVGGGSFPERDLPTTLVTLEAREESLSIQAVRDALLRTDPPLVGRVDHDAFSLDPRTLDRKEYKLVVEALKQAIEMARG